MSDLIYRIYTGDVRKQIERVANETVHLIVTSIPYGNIKKYSSDKREIGHGMTQKEYYKSINQVLVEGLRILKPGCRMIVNVGDEFVSATKSKPAYIIHHQSQIISDLMIKSDVIFKGMKRWEKVTTSKTAGGGKILGSVYHPPNPNFFINYEHLLEFQKLGKRETVSKEVKESARWTLEERRKWVRDKWDDIPPVKQNGHIAMFPEEIPYRYMRMHTFPGETICDLFLGSGTTMKVAGENGRSCVGFELGFDVHEFGTDWKDIITEKVFLSIPVDTVLEFLRER